MENEKKSNKTLVFVLVVIISILIIGFIVVYVVMSGKDGTTTGSSNSVNQVVNVMPSSDTQGESTTYIGDDFTLMQPAGWVQTTIANTLASFVKQNETQPTGSAAEKIHFKSYIAVSFDNTEGKTLDEVYQQTLDGIETVVSSPNIFKVTDETVNGLSSKFSAMEFSSQDVNYTALVVVIFAGDRFFTVTFNTTTEKWPEYNTLAYQVARSFQLK